MTKRDKLRLRKYLSTLGALVRTLQALTENIEPPRERKQWEPTVNDNVMAKLTRCETVAVRLAIQGFSNREIAIQVGLTEHTVKNYIFRAFDKLGVSNRVELVLCCLQQDEQNKEKDFVPSSSGGSL